MATLCVLVSGLNRLGCRTASATNNGQIMRFGLGKLQHLMIARDGRNPLDVGCCDQKAVHGIASSKERAHFGCFEGYSTRQVRELEAGEFENGAKPLCSIASAEIGTTIGFSQRECCFPDGDRRYQ